MNEFHMTFLSSYWTYERPWRIWCTCGWSESWKTKRTAKTHGDRHLNEKPNEHGETLYKILAGEDEDAPGQR